MFKAYAAEGQSVGEGHLACSVNNHSLSTDWR